MDTVMDFDLGFLGSPSPREQDFELPKNEGFQSFAQHMEQDKILTLSTDAETESFSFYDTSDLKALFDIGVQDEDNTEDVNVEALIDEVQDTLQRYDKGQLALPSGEAEVVAESVGKEELNLKFSEEEMAAAESFLDELLKSNEMDLNFSDVEVQNLQDTTTKDQEETIVPAEIEQQPSIQDENSKVLNLTPVGSFKIENQDDSGFFDMSNVTEVFTEDGRQIIIMVAPPSSPSPTPTKTEENHFESDADSEWTPDSPKSAKGRPPVKRNAKQRKRSTPYITDKKERKKHQNVEAARRYRDKKKAEQCNIEDEEQGLMRRNKELKAKVSEMEAEMKTMKKLMKELGILK